MNERILYLVLIMSALLTSCREQDSYKSKLNVNYKSVEPETLEIKHYNEALFSLDTANFYEELMSVSSDYPFFFDNMNDVRATSAFLKDFVRDSFAIMLNDKAVARYKNDEKLKNDIKSVFQRYNYYYGNMKAPEVYFYVSGISYDTPPVFIDDNDVLISLDFYLGNKEGIYDLVGMPRYISLRCEPDYIVRDVAKSLYNSKIAEPRQQKDLLTEMIGEGKMYYFMEAMNPSLPDSVLMGYSSSQMQWVEQYEADVWASIVGNNMLYANNMEMFRTFFGDGPFTQAYSNKSPARLGEYIGLQIIRSYMSNNDVSLQELIANDDVQQIFQDSQYKPKMK